MSHVVYMKETYPTYERELSRAWMRHVMCMNVSWRWALLTSLGFYTSETGHTYE